MQPLTVKTERTDVLLRQYTENDAAEIFELIDRNRVHLSQWGEYIGKEYPTVEVVKEMIRYPLPPGFVRLGIWRAGELVGAVNLRPLPARFYAAIGYWLGSEYEHKGLMTCAVRALVNYAFQEVEYFYLTANVATENVRSQRVLERVGFVRTSGSEHYLNYKLRAIDWSDDFRAAS